MLSAKRLQSLLCLLCLAGLGCLCAHGQNREAPLPSLLTPESQAVLDKLASLSALPAPDWRYHAGALQHGESPSLDDAGWQAVTTGATLPGEALWMRATTKLPQPPAGLWSLPVWNDELYFEYHRGVMTSQAAHKRNMRESEEEMLNAEKWSSIAWLSGTPYPAPELNEAWKKVLFNQFHDLAAGSGIGVIYKDAQKDYDMVRSTADAATSQALGAIASYVDTQSRSKGVPVLVFNPLAWVRGGVVDFTVQLPEAAPAIEIVDEAGQVLPSESIAHQRCDPHLLRPRPGFRC
jgi:hypothetical protein